MDRQETTRTHKKGKGITVKSEELEQQRKEKKGQQRKLQRRTGKDRISQI
jgi:hypothetical protein